LKNNLKASFFCIGWIAERYPNLVKNISDCGYDVGPHSFYHRRVFKISDEDFETDLKKSVYSIEDAIGKKVIMYRAPGFSFNKNSKEKVQILINNGIEIDSSICSASLTDGGNFKSNINSPALLKVGSSTIKEYPLNYYSILGKKFIVQGGGYFRLFPEWLIRMLTYHADYTLSYFHPRDFDYEQPTIENLTLFQKFRSYYGLDRAMQKLENLIKYIEFTDISTTEQSVDWVNAPIYEL